MAVVRCNDQQNIVAAVPLSRHGIDHHAGVTVGLTQHGQMLGRAERHVVLDVVRLAAPQHAQGGPAAVDDFGDETLCHRPVAARVQRDVQGIIDRLAVLARPKTRGDKHDRIRRGHARAPRRARRC